MPVRRLPRPSIALVDPNCGHRGTIGVLSPQDVGHRVSVRRRTPDGPTDVVGHLVELTDDAMTVLRRSGEVVSFDPRAVTAGKVVPPQPVRRAATVAPRTPAELQRIAWASWPAREHRLLGDWVLRAHSGVTSRANAVLAAGDPGRDLDDAFDTVREWYAERSLPALLQLPLGEPADRLLAARGEARHRLVVMQVAAVTPVVGALTPVSGLRTVVEPRPSAEWVALCSDAEPATIAAYLAILTGPPVVGFATLHAGDEPVAIGRVSVDGQWAGITSLEVAPHHRRAGLGTAAMRVLLDWAAERGARWSYLQVLIENDAALRLYSRLGYVTHHVYGYRQLSG
jgi:ribosomal protein S18 acetylase RimI-like enzyme